MRFIFIALFLLLASCAKETTTQTIREIQPTTFDVDVYTCQCFRSGVRVYGPATCTAAVFSRDSLGRLYYDIQEYPANRFVRVFGTCTRTQ